MSVGIKTKHFQKEWFNAILFFYAITLSFLKITDLLLILLT